MTLPPVLALDLDGTLVDTAQDLVATLNTILARHGCPARPFAEARDSVGLGARHMLDVAFKADGRTADDATLDALLAEFVTHYASRIAEESRPYPGVVDALDRFAASGWRLAICTNKLEGLARELLEALELTDRFAAITGQDTFAFRKPDPRHLTETVRLAGGDPASAVMVGDSITDIRTAQAATVPVVAVSFGYSPTPVAAFGPDRIIDHFDDLWDAVATLHPAAKA